MNRADTASARHHTYLLFSRLYLDGLTGDLLPYIAKIPELAAAAPRPFDLNDAAATHYQIFAHDIFPYESIFRDPSGLLGTIYADQVKATYEHTGIHIKADYDHFGHELAFLAASCSAESGASSDQDNEAADQFEQLQRTFTQDHLLCWLPPFVTALSFSNQPFYAALGRLTQSLVYDHMVSFSRARSEEPSSGFDKNSLPDPADFLQDSQTSLKQIAGFLITPPYSGIYIGRSAITALARERQLPRGFGSRQQMLSNLFHTAAQYDLVPELLQDLTEHVNSWSHRYEEQLEVFPKMSPWIRPWLQRVFNTVSALSKMITLSAAAI